MANLIVSLVIATVVTILVGIRDKIKSQKENKTAIVIELDYKFIIQRQGDKQFVGQIKDFYVGESIHAQQYRTQQAAELDAKKMGFERILIHPQPR